MQFNHRLRRRLTQYGLPPSPVGASPFRDGLKARVLPVADKLWTLAAKARFCMPFAFLQENIAAMM
jgi:hypothetical protein